MITLLALTLGLNTATAQECSGQISSVELDTQLDSVAMGFLEYNWEKIEKGLASIEAKVPCLSESIDPEVANDYHMLSGLYLYYLSQSQGNTEGEEQALNSLRLAKRLAPDKTIPKHIFPDGHEIHDIYDGLEYIELDNDIPTANRGVYIFNGQTINRPKDTTSIVQIKEGSTILMSRIVKPGASLPIVATAVTTTSSVTETVKEEPKKVVETAPTVTETTPMVMVQQPVAETPRKGSSALVWTGTFAVATASAALIPFYGCGSVVCTQDELNTNLQIGNGTLVEMTEDNISIYKGANYAMLALSGFSAYKMLTAKKKDASTEQ